MVVHNKRVVAVGSDRQCVVTEAAALENCDAEDLVRAGGAAREFGGNSALSNWSRLDTWFRPQRQSPSTGGAVHEITVGGVTIQVARLLISPCFPFVGLGSFALPRACWLDSGAPISVIPFRVHHRRLPWQSLGVQATWSTPGLRPRPSRGLVQRGASCSMAGPFSLLAKFPRNDPPGGTLCRFCSDSNSWWPTRRIDDTAAARQGKHPIALNRRPFLL